MTHTLNLIDWLSYLFALPWLTYFQICNLLFLPTHFFYQNGIKLFALSERILQYFHYGVHILEVNSILTNRVLETANQVSLIGNLCFYLCKFYCWLAATQEYTFLNVDRFHGSHAVCRLNKVQLRHCLQISVFLVQFVVFDFEFLQVRLQPEHLLN